MENFTTLCTIIHKKNYVERRFNVKKVLGLKFISCLLTAFMIFKNTLISIGYYEENILCIHFYNFCMNGKDNFTYEKYF